MAKVKNADQGTSLLKISMRRFRKNKLAMAGIIALLILIIVSICAPLISPYGRDSQDLLNTFAKPSKAHLLGTDDFGRDSFTRLLYGGRVSLLVGLVSTSISLLIGVILGATSGYFGGKVDMIIMRIVDIFMCFPFYVLAICAAAVFGGGLWMVMIVSGLLSWTGICRIVRAEVMSLKTRDFVEAARAQGLNSAEIITKHIFPNIVAVIIVYATLGIASGILSEAGLSFLGLGVKVPQASWGNILAAAQDLRCLRLYPWLWIPAGILVFITVFSINVVGDGLRDALDPKLKK